MTTLTITPNWKNKTAKFKGTIAAGEHVAVSIANDDGYITDTTNLRLRVVHPANGKTLAQFPMPETDEDEAGGENEILPSSEAPAEGEVDWASDTTPLFCILNLNTDRMLMAVPPAANVPLLFVLDDYEGKTLYFKDYCDVTHWPRRVGEEEPVNLDDYKDIIADFREDIYGTGGFKDRVENAEAAAVAAAVSAAAAETSASGANTGAWAAANAAAASSATALQAQSAAETAKADAISAKTAAVAAQGAAETAQTAAETAQGKAEDAQEAAEAAASEAGSAAASAVATETARAEAAEEELANNLAVAFTGVSYNSTTKKIIFTKKNGTTAEIDATAFIKDGMVSQVYIGTGDDAGKLVIVFNSDAGKQPIKISLTDIFNPANYYDRMAANKQFVAKEEGKGLSTNDYDNTEKGKVATAATKVANATSGNFAGLDSNGNLTDSGKKASDFAAATHPHTASDVSGLATVATSGSYNDLADKPTIPDAQVQSDWNESDNTKKSFIKNKPTIPTVPTVVSAFTNDAGYLTEHQDISGKANKNEMSVTPGTGANADKTTIQLKEGMSATVLTSLADGAVTTEKIATKAVTKAKLSSAVQSVLNNSYSAAPAFDQTSAYAIGDLVTYENKLYRFKSAHAANTQWNSSEVDDIDLAKGHYILKIDPETGGIYYTVPDTQS